MAFTFSLSWCSRRTVLKRQNASITWSTPGGEKIGSRVIHFRLRGATEGDLLDWQDNDLIGGDFNTI